MSDVSRSTERRQLTVSAPGERYRPDIDGLRAIAVLAVFIFHLRRTWLPGGFVGVDVFFVISGYLITGILLRDCARGSFSATRFYQRRIARLLPAFSAVALATVVAAAVIYSDQDFASAGSNLVALSLSAANLKLMLQGNYFVLSADAQPFLHYWSLAVEEQFYLFFPLIFLLIFRKATHHTTHVLVALAGVSFIACVALTRVNPVWAFYLLPTRAWELLIGGALATRTGGAASWRPPRLLPFVGLALVGASVFVIRDGPSFPGYVALLPTIGTVFLLAAADVSTSAAASRLLTATPVVAIGRASYSLYLCHWPIFSFIDYELYTASTTTRVALKVLLSAVATTTCYLWIERPLRRRLNEPARRRSAFAVLATSIAVLVPIGVSIRRAHYLNADLSDVPRGGIVYNDGARSGSVVLMGDSNGSMYGTTLKALAKELHFRLNVISVAAADPLPRPNATSALWMASAAFIRRERPDAVILVCNWADKLAIDASALDTALAELKNDTRRVVLLTQPPELPLSATRDSIREGSRAPFFENAAEQSRRLKANEFVKRRAGGNVTVLDIESLFRKPDGQVIVSDSTGRQIFQDADHLSAAGASRVARLLRQALSQPIPGHHG